VVEKGDKRERVTNARTDATLRSLYFINDKTGWAVGDNGTILYTVDGGTFWIRQFKI